MEENVRSAEQAVLDILHGMKEAATELGGPSGDGSMSLEFYQGQVEVLDAAIRIIEGVFEV